MYAFKHALVQDTAYSTMLRARRQQLHGAIAAVLENRFPEVISSTPEIVAQQFEGAGRTEQAIRYWRQAGDRDLRRFAMKEAIALGHVPIKFTDTRGGTELVVPLDRNRSDLRAIESSNGSAAIKVVGDLTLDYVRVTCVARIDLATLEGEGHLERVG